VGLYIVRTDQCGVSGMTVRFIYANSSSELISFGFLSKYVTGITRRIIVALLIKSINAGLIGEIVLIGLPRLQSTALVEQLPGWVGVLGRGISS
jgi:hypothetical protein